MTFESPSFPLGFPCASMWGGVADITWNGPFCVDRKAELAATHKHPVKKNELHLKHIRILTMS